MFAKSVIALAAVASVVVAAPVEQRGAPKDWAYGYLENYDTYHVRYLALKCYEKKHTDYFQDCCRPMLSTENLHDNRKAYCVPSQESTDYVVSSLSAKAAGHSATPTASADVAAESEYCEEESSVSSSVAWSSSSSAAWSSSSSAAWSSSSAAAASPAATSQVGEQRVAPAPAAASSSSTTTTSSTPAWTPAPTTSSTPAWTPAPTTKAPAPTTQAPAPTTQAPAPQQQSSGGESFNGGFATYFFQGGNAGACGQVHGDWDMIVAIDHEKWGSGSFGNGSPTCGRWLTVTNTKNGRSVAAMVADVCPTCANGNSLDLSQGAFNAIASESDGMVPISWHWN